MTRPIGYAGPSRGGTSTRRTFSEVVRDREREQQRQAMPGYKPDPPAQLTIEEYSALSPYERKAAREDGSADQARGVGDYNDPVIHNP